MCVSSLMKSSPSPGQTTPPCWGSLLCVSCMSGILGAEPPQAKHQRPEISAMFWGGEKCGPCETSGMKKSFLERRGKGKCLSLSKYVLSFLHILPYQTTRCSEPQLQFPRGPAIWGPLNVLRVHSHSESSPLLLKCPSAQSS